VSSARNKGIRLSSSKWIALLDSDDEWYPEKLEKQVKAIQEKPDHQFCHTEEIWVRNGVRVNQMKKHQKYGGHIFEKCLDMCRISPSSVLFQKSILDKTGWFDKELRVCEDYDLWLRVTARYPTLYLDEPLIIKYGGYKDQLSNVKGGIESYRINVLEKLMLIDLTTDQKRLVREMLIQKLSIYAKGAQNRGRHSIYKKSIKRINELST
jgi:glycosyltransferase involved in cell wall biosynthesis